MGIGAIFGFYERLWFDEWSGHVKVTSLSNDIGDSKVDDAAVLRGTIPGRLVHYGCQ